MHRGAWIATVVAICATGLGVAAVIAAEAMMRPVDAHGARSLRAGRAQDFSVIERGRYLATVADCASCHTGPGNPRRFSGGRPIETPFGFVAAPNITPDSQTGIGAWSDAQFDAAVRRGKRRDGKPLYPAMPFVYYAKMSRDDVLAIRAFLDTVPAVSHKVVVNRLPFPFDVRAAMLVWDALYFRKGEFTSDAGKSADWNRGAFLVEGPGHCGACHTPKTFLGGDKDKQAFRGYAIQGWFAPDLTNDQSRGLGRWSKADIVAYLKSGHNRMSAATGPMAEEVTLSSAHMTDADLGAIAAYLKELPERNDPRSALPASDPGMIAGRAIYRDACSACHAPDGHGVAELFPDLARASSVRSSDPASLIRVVLRGARSAATAAAPTEAGMPAFAWQLDDEQVADVLTYLRNVSGDAAPPVTPSNVARVRHDLLTRNE